MRLGNGVCNPAMVRDAHGLSLRAFSDTVSSIPTIPIPIPMTTFIAMPISSINFITTTTLHPPDPNRPADLLPISRNHNTLLQNLTPTLISQLINQPPHLGHSFPPSLTPYSPQFILRKSTGDFGRAERLGWMAGGEEGGEVGM